MALKQELQDFINFDTTYIPEFSIHDTSVQDGIVQQDISFSNHIGETVGTYIVKPETSGRFPGIHFIHWLETKANNSNRRQFLPHAIDLAKRGYMSILPDCFWSLEKEDFKENPQKYTSRWWRTNFEHDSQLVKKQLIELILSHNILLSQPEIISDRVGLVAHDFGAMMGTLLPSMGVNYKAYVLIAFTGRFSHWFKFGSKLPKEHPKEFAKYVNNMGFLDPINHIHHLTDSSILMQFADDDFYVPKENAEKLFEKAGEEKEIVWYHAKHAMTPQSFKDMKTWICDIL